MKINVKVPFTVEELGKKRDVQEAVQHSDQGFQYTSKQYNARIKDLGMKGSHSRKGNCFDNAPIGSFQIKLNQCAPVEYRNTLVS